MGNGLIRKQKLNIKTQHPDQEQSLSFAAPNQPINE